MSDQQAFLDSLTDDRIEAFYDAERWYGDQYLEPEGDAEEE